MNINGKTYKVPELDFNAICELEDMGVVLTDMDKKVLTTVRGFLALSMGSDMETAGKELGDHLASGGTIDDMVKEINKAVSESGFFQALSQSKTKGIAESKKQETEEE